MKHLRKITLLVLVLALLLSVCGCKPEQAPATEPATEPVATEDVRQKELAELYQSAIDAVAGDNLALEVKYDRTVTVAGVAYKESAEITQDYWNMGTEDFLAKVKQTVTFGDDDYEVEMTEIFSGGKVYQELEDSKYTVEMTAEDYTDMYTPLQMLDPALYTLDGDEAKTYITFDSATAGEAWLPEDIALNSASGKAELDSDGKLTKTTYTVDYVYGNANIVLTYEAVVAEEGRKPEVPESEEGYVLLDQISAGYVMEHAYGYLNQAKHLSYDYGSLTMSAAGAMIMQDNANVDAYAVGEEYAAKIEQHIFIKDYSTDQEQEVEQTHKFTNGKYTLSVNGGREEPDNSVDRQDMETEVKDGLISVFQVETDIASVETTNLGSLILFEYTGTEEMSESMCKDISQVLFGSGDILNNLASKYTTNEMSLYLSLDRYSLLPVAMGLKYEAEHRIQGQDLILSRQMDIAFDLASMSSYDAIFEEPAPETEPENSAAPLFYHVTGQDGQEMWLLGTIHVGDERTGFLPQEIYDALSASDALAVECDVDAFHEQAEEDEELSEKVSDCYYYSDDTTAADHIVTPDLYDAAIQMMKATGNYNYNTEYMKVNLLGNMIDNFYLQQGYLLTGEKGVDNRLLAIAEEEDIPVREVESTLFQMEMTSNYSDELQEFMLFSSLAGDAQDYWESLSELYELWCSGDEAKLIEELTEEPWEITEEDLEITEDMTDEDKEKVEKIRADLDNINAQLKVLQEEYEKAMSIDRNVGMLEVAKEYLESGDTVFYAVGLAHLLAENGLVNTLREAGYTVELVTYQ